MSKRSKTTAAPAALPSTGGSFVLGADGKLVPNTSAVNTQPNPGKSAREVDAPSKRPKSPLNEPLTPAEPGDVNQNPEA